MENKTIIGILGIIIGVFTIVFPFMGYMNFIGYGGWYWIITTLLGVYFIII